MISKELLSEVLGKNVIEDCSEINVNILKYKYQTVVHVVYSEINIYELAYKCKEWASEQGYELKSYLRNDGFCYIEDMQFISCTEPEAIFKACEWILEQQ